MSGSISHMGRCRTSTANSTSSRCGPTATAEGWARRSSRSSKSGCGPPAPRSGSRNAPGYIDVERLRASYTRHGFTVGKAGAKMPQLLGTMWAPPTPLLLSHDAGTRRGKRDHQRDQAAGTHSPNNVRPGLVAQGLLTADSPQLHSPLSSLAGDGPSVSGCSERKPAHCPNWSS
jgi:hypothetical protein